MNSYSFYDYGLAEAMYCFIDDASQRSRWELESFNGDISIAEYCHRHFFDFKAFCERCLGFTVYTPNNVKGGKYNA